MIQETHITACRSGSPRAQRHVYESTIKLAYSITRRYIRDEAFHQDILQEAYAKVFAKISTYDPSRGNFTGWLSQVVVNECLMYLRKHKRIAKLVPLDDYHYDTSYDDHIAIETLSREDVDQILVDMPSGYRVVFMLYVIDGYSHKEIAEKVGISMDTSRSQLSRAKKWMKNHLITHPIVEEYGQH